ncbi:MAG: GGDEF domain-containing protein [Elusimicrobia bacterium]|nr:GGDEF domain-containing protein [Elusimicrobiota bacterium]
MSLESRERGVRIDPATGLPFPPMLVRFTQILARVPRWRAAVWSLALAVVIGAADHATGYRSGLSRFQVIPVALAAWTLGREIGLALALGCVSVWTGGEFLGGGWTMLAAWNAVVRALFLLSTAVVISALRRAVDEERHAARTDFLTGIPNRRSFVEAARAEIMRGKRYRRPFIVAYLDIDGFKAINDKFGHNQGDALLRIVGQTMRRGLREVDTVARIGGDEFALLMPETDGLHAEKILSKLQMRLMRQTEQNGWNVTFSIGSVTYVSPPTSVDEMTKTADRLLYEVKNTGKNQIRFETVGGERLAGVRVR